jgi:hypothetical protein
MLQKLKLEWLWFKLSYTFRFAHHPLCERYQDQRYQIGSVHLCQGCTLVTLGTIISALLAFLAIFFLSIPWQYFILTNIIALLPALIADGLRLGRRAKRFARFSLGLALGTTIGLIVVVPLWWLKVSLIIIGVFAIIAYRRFRSYTPKEDLCQTCPHLEEAPYCPGYILQMQKNKEYKELALPVLQPDLEARMSALQAGYQPKVKVDQ